MDADDASSLRRLFDHAPVASLATLHGGEPAVSMVPFVLPAGSEHVAIHVSQLSPHTGDMLVHPRVGLMVMADPQPGVMPQALPRVALQADAQALPREGEAYARARVHYLARYPDAALTFELADFSIFLLRPVSARLIAGFGRAHGLVGAALLAWLRNSGQ